MMITSIFMNNRTQAVRLPSLYRFSEQTQKVFVRIVGVERVLSPTDKIWDSFFYSPTLKVSDDFERGEQIDSQRESF
ncbi:MAG: AbrB/MazE/SpoVT family DNA-binding domain-containing protein [Agitococcus sp.]|jgi:antitoxin VapB|nr:AbrB/MazE/SpoVT family DNA-binding domain-containing protein [Moraxellaceae bacterium]MBP9216130.1 AbrB/MazE/SpoVT family DNA-binding domain-containing protein [Agitococcus sp.]MBK7299316.1 AbrB/MazE/SpoVT family DNA-binding domain-containing protein [Moraxellaceae bacterium]MBK8326644.1 AbrB/MazE/SpoVT family DNA-binding domain-containing protein [Moraxellaceae bacterium]MBK9187283.1 AbrB/MazE/SpoVT family DNA-binding domain-containing protein [Moraxellaceae bacterium]